MLLADGERTMLSDRGAAGRLAVADLPPLDGVDHLHLSGYVLGGGSCAAGVAALAAARTAGASTSLDPQGSLPARFLPGLGGVDLLLPNTPELEALAGSPDPTSTAAWLTGADPEAALRAGCAAGAEAVSRRGGRPVHRV